MRIVAATGDTLHLVESESSVDALNSGGHYATTWAGGATTPPLAKLAAVPHATGWLPPRPGHDVRDVIATDRTLTTLRPILPGSPSGQDKRLLSSRSQPTQSIP